MGHLEKHDAHSNPEYIYASLAMLSLYAQVPGVAGGLRLPGKKLAAKSHQTW